ncbi:hypothetical protein JG687_00012548, partial [Phytophthora cactorum]
VKERFEVYVEPKVLLLVVRQPCLDVNLVGVRCSSSLLNSVVLDLEIDCYRQKFEEYIVRNPLEPILRLARPPQIWQHRRGNAAN